MTHIEPAITNTALNELVLAADRFHEEAMRCANCDAFQAACLMAVASFEARLIATAGFLETQLRAASVWPSDKRMAGNLLAWDLGTALRVATDAGWFPDDPGLPPSTIADAVRACKDLRNACAHPAAYVREVGYPIEEAVFVGVYNVLDHASGILGDVLASFEDPPIGSS